jgi:putative transposase
VKKSRSTDSQIVAVLKEVELGAKVGETCRKRGISELTHHKWKSQLLA